MAYTRNYRTKIHQALLVEIKAAKTAFTGAVTGYSVLQDSILNRIISSKDKDTVKANNYQQVFVYKANQIENTQSKTEILDYTQVYVKLGLLLAIFNKQLKKADTPYITFAIDVGENNYRTIDGHLSIDPQVCLLPSTLEALLERTQSTDPTLVYDLLLNVDFVTKVLDDFIDDSGHVFLFDFFEQLFSEIERVTGGINDYELQYYESSSQLSIVDRNYLSPTPGPNYPVVSIFGVDSIVKSVNLVTKISPRLSSMVAISAQDSPFTSTEESTGFAALSKDLENGILNSLTDEGVEEAGALAEAAEVTYDQALEKFQEDMTTLLQHLLAIYGPPKILNLETSYGVSSIYQNFCSMTIGKKNDPSYSFIIPFEVSLKFHGISGLRVLESFKISRDVLPETYGGSSTAQVAFVITGVEHTVSRGEWSTNIKTQIFNVNDKGTINGGTPYKSYWKIGGIPQLGGGYKAASNLETLPGNYSTASDNNPFNIRANNGTAAFNGVIGQKEGFRGTNSIGYFLVFDTLENGVRAGMKNLSNNYFPGGKSTVKQVITKYAPPSDGNSTSTYITGVVEYMKQDLSDTSYLNLTADTPLLWSGPTESSPSNKAMFKSLSKAIVLKEGPNASSLPIINGFDLTKLA